jgi:hypothetical protein
MDILKVEPKCCDTLTRDDAGHMNIGATLTNGRTVREYGGRSVYIY